MSRSFDELAAEAAAGFTVDAHAGRLRDLHDRIATSGPFVAHSARTLFDARRPA